MSDPTDADERGEACPTCGGNGRGETAGHTRHGLAFHPCSTCNGSGRATDGASE